MDDGAARQTFFEKVSFTEVKKRMKTEWTRLLTSRFLSAILTDSSASAAPLGEIHELGTQPLSTILCNVQLLLFCGRDDVYGYRQGLQLAKPAP